MQLNIPLSGRGILSTKSDNMTCACDSTSCQCFHAKFRLTEIDRNRKMKISPSCEYLLTRPPLLLVSHLSSCVWWPLCVSCHSYLWSVTLGLPAGLPRLEEEVGSSILTTIQWFWWLVQAVQVCGEGWVYQGWWTGFLGLSWWYKVADVKCMFRESGLLIVLGQPLQQLLQTPPSSLPTTWCSILTTWWWLKKFFAGLWLSVFFADWPKIWISKERSSSSGNFRGGRVWEGCICTGIQYTWSAR